MNEKKIINELPNEILIRIFGFFSPKELIDIRPVCQKWKNISDDDSLWRSFLYKDYGLINSENPRQDYKKLKENVNIGIIFVGGNKITRIQLLERLESLHLRDDSLVLNKQITFGLMLFYTLEIMNIKTANYKGFKITACNKDKLDIITKNLHFLIICPHDINNLQQELNKYSRMNMVANSGIKIVTLLFRDNNQFTDMKKLAEGSCIIEVPTSLNKNNYAETSRNIYDELIQIRIRDVLYLDQEQTRKNSYEVSESDCELVSNS